MSATDADSLAEKIEQALWGLTRVYDAPHGGTETGVHAPVHEVVAAVLPVVAATEEAMAERVREAKAEALRNAALDVSFIEMEDDYERLDYSTSREFYEDMVRDWLRSLAIAAEALDSARATHCPEEGRA